MNIDGQEKSSSTDLPGITRVLGGEITLRFFKISQEKKKKEFANVRSWRGSLTTLTPVLLERLVDYSSDTSECVTTWILIMILNLFYLHRYLGLPRPPTMEVYLHQLRAIKA